MLNLQYQNWLSKFWNHQKLLFNSLNFYKGSDFVCLHITIHNQTLMIVLFILVYLNRRP